MTKRRTVVLPHGIQSAIARKCGIQKSSVSYVFNGRRRATAQQAALMEGYFIQKGIPLTRWDLLYGIDTENEESIAEYLERRKNQGE